MTTQVRGLPCLSKSGHGKPRLSYNGHMPKPLSFHIDNALPAGKHLTMARHSRKRRTKPTPYRTIATNSASLGRMSNNMRRKIMEAPKYKTATTGNTARSREWDGGNAALPAMRNLYPSMSANSFRFGISGPRCRQQRETRAKSGLQNELASMDSDRFLQIDSGRWAAHCRTMSSAQSSRRPA